MGDFAFSPWALGFGVAIVVAAWTAYPHGRPDYLLAVGAGAVAFTLPHVTDFLLAIVREMYRLARDDERQRVLVGGPPEPPRQQQTGTGEALGEITINHPQRAAYTVPRMTTAEFERDRVETVLRAQVLAFLDACILMYGPANSQIIPRHHRIGYSSTDWTAMVEALGAAAVRKPRSSTWIMGFENIRELRAAVASGQQRLDLPAPVEGKGEVRELQG